MKRIIFLLTTISLSLGFGCMKNLKRPLKNEAKVIANERLIDESTAHIPDSVHLKLLSIDNTAGSVSSLEMRFQDSIDGMKFTLSIIMPACPLFSMRHANNGNFEFNIDTFPFTIKSNDYRPFPNVLHKTEEKFQCIWEVQNLHSQKVQYEYFDLISITIDKAGGINNKIDLGFTLIASSLHYDAVFTVDITDHEYGLIMVD